MEVADRFFINCDCLFCDILRAVKIATIHPSSSTEPSSQSGITQEALASRRHRFCILRRNEKAISFILDDFRDSSDGGRHQRTAKRHRLKKHVTHGIELCSNQRSKVGYPQ